MYRKKEIGILIGLALAVLIIFYALYFSSTQKSIVKKGEASTELIQIRLEGEVVRIVEVTYVYPISYGILFLRLKYNFNEYSDLSSFSFEELITKSLTLTIPTKDLHNHYEAEEKVYIHSSGLEDLLKLPQIGEKRAKKILEYIEKNGKINSWETFFEITNVPEYAKIQIQRQAVL